MPGLLENNILELDFNRLLFRGVSLEEIVFLELQHIVDDIGRKDLNHSIEITDIAIVEAASGLNFVFRIGELILKL